MREFCRQKRLSGEKTGEKDERNCHKFLKGRHHQQFLKGHTPIFKGTTPSSIFKGTLPSPVFKGTTPPILRGQYQCQMELPPN
jgi:hypothetical protein